MGILSKFIGNTGEKYAEKFLKSHGYTILETQHKEKYVEIDIIAEKEKKIYIFEVKTVSHENNSSVKTKSVSHRNNYTNEFERVNTKKLKKMGIFGDYYLNNHVEYVGISMGIIIISLFKNKDNKNKKPIIKILWV